MNKVRMEPQYGSPLEALQGTTADWGDRLTAAENWYEQLDGELPSAMRQMAAVIIDGYESPDLFSLLDMYNRHDLDPNSFGVLLQVNFEGETVPPQTHDLLDAIQEQRQRSRFQTALSVRGYEGQRKIDQLKQDTWDLGVVHALKHGIQHPITGLSNDADMTDASLDYFPHMLYHESVYQRQPLLWGSAIEYDQPGGSDLPLNKLLGYLMVGRNLNETFLGMPVIWGASMACTLETFVTTKGWTRASKDAHAYGGGESANMMMNIWDLQNGQVDDAAYSPTARKQTTERVDGLAWVSPRRELFAYAQELGVPDNIVPLLTTKPDNPYRGLSKPELAQLAATVDSVDEPMFVQHLNMNDTSWFKMTPTEEAEAVKDVLRTARLDLGLPIVGFDLQ